MIFYFQSIWLSININFIQNIIFKFISTKNFELLNYKTIY